MEGSGFFGCNWKDRDTSDGLYLPESGERTADLSSYRRGRF